MTAALASATRPSGGVRTLAVTATPAPVDLDAVAMYASAGNRARWLWVDPGAELVQVGLGAAHTLTADGPDRFAAVADGMRRLGFDGTPDPTRPAPLLVGGFAFDHRQPPVRRPPWPDWPAARMVVPSLSYVRRAGRAWWLAAGDGQSAGATIARAEAAARSGWEPVQGPLAGRAADPAVDDAHEALVAEALRVLGAGSLTKVVVARCFDLEQPVAEASLLHRLCRQHRDCVTFAVGHGQWAFVGATPERLVSLDGDCVLTAAVAGTARRGVTDDEDRRLAQWLAADDKERREHDLVLDDIRGALARTGVAVAPTQPTTVLTLSGCHHLHTEVRGRRRHPHTTVVDLAGALHPTPAVAGTPTGAAVEWIREHEHMDRGWYAAPVGWVDAHGQGEFRVALRSALCGPERTHLFAGGGIVLGSDPRRELAETAVKLQAVLAPVLSS
jgi:isochorismate synthase